MKCADIIRSNMGEADWKLRKLCGIRIGDLVAALDKIVETVELAEAQGCLYVRHPVIESKADLFVIPRSCWACLRCLLATEQRRVTGYAVSSEQGHGLGQIVVVGRGQAAFTRRDDLDRVEAENGDVRPPATADRFAGAAGTYGMGGVFQNGESVLLAETPDFFLLNGLSREMDWYDYFGEAVVLPRECKLGFQGRDAQIACGRIDINEIHPRTTVQSTVGRGWEGVWHGP